MPGTFFSPFRSASRYSNRLPYGCPYFVSFPGVDPTIVYGVSFRTKALLTTERLCLGRSPISETARSRFYAAAYGRTWFIVTKAGLTSSLLFHLKAKTLFHGKSFGLHLYKQGILSGFIRWKITDTGSAVRMSEFFIRMLLKESTVEIPLYNGAVSKCQDPFF